jgi:hypothetical protein
MPPSRWAISFLLALLLGAGLVTGCGSAGTIRRFTYPPDFKYLERSEVKSAMGALARDVRALKRLLAGTETLDADQRAEVARLLRAMEATAAELDPKGRRTNHPVIDQNIGAFRRDIEMARLAAERDPPNYFLAGSVAGSCSYCHEGQR